MKKRGKRAWLVYWTGREDRIDKRTGTIVCILPWRYSVTRVQDIVEGIYLAYWHSFPDQFEFATRQNRSRQRIAELCPGGVFVGKNPGLFASLCEDVCVASKKRIQELTWTTLPIYRRNGRHEIIEEIAGTPNRYVFDFENMREVSSTLPKC